MYRPVSSCHCLQKMLTSPSVGYKTALYCILKTQTILHEQEIPFRTRHLQQIRHPGFCKSATTDEIREHGYVLTPGRYVGAAEIENDGVPFEEKMTVLSTALYEQFAEADRFEAVIRKNLEVLGYGK